MSDNTLTSWFRPEHQVERLLQHDGKAEGGEQRGEQVAVDHLADDYPVNEPAEPEHDRYRHRYRPQWVNRRFEKLDKRDPGSRNSDPDDVVDGQIIGDVATHDDELALGQVLDVHDAPNQRKPVGRQGEDRADHQAVQQQLNVEDRGLYEN
jgi:hypothetical protein